MEVGGTNLLQILIPLSLKMGNVATGIHPGMPRDFLPQGWQWAYDSIRSTSREVAAPYIPGKTPTTVFDFFVISPNVELKSVRTAETGFNNSNHQPVRLEFILIYKLKFFAYGSSGVSVNFYKTQ